MLTNFIKKIISESLNPDAVYKKRTELNVRDSEGTFIIVKDALIGGTLYTLEMVEKYKRPYLIFSLLDNCEVIHVVNWVLKNNIRELNIAGPRASEVGEVYELAWGVIQSLLTHS